MVASQNKIPAVRSFSKVESSADLPDLILVVARFCLQLRQEVCHSINLGVMDITMKEITIIEVAQVRRCLIIFSSFSVTDPFDLTSRACICRGVHLSHLRCDTYTVHRLQSQDHTP